VGIVSDAWHLQTGQVSVETGVNTNISVFSSSARRDIPVRCGANEQRDRRLGIVISERRGLVLERDQHLADAGNSAVTVASRMVSASREPSASPFSKSSPAIPIVFVTCARQSTRVFVALAKA
jgi:hypothetical protein